MHTYKKESVGKFIDKYLLIDEVKKNETITAKCYDVEFFPDTEYLKVYFTTEPSAGELTELDSVIAAHTDTPYESRISVVNSDRTLQPWEMVVGVTGLSAHRTFTLPPAAYVDPLHILSIADEDESCKGNQKMKLVVQGADTISGVTEAKQPGSVLFARSNGVDTWVVRAI